MAPTPSPRRSPAGPPSPPSIPRGSLSGRCQNGGSNGRKTAKCTKKAGPNPKNLLVSRRKVLGMPPESPGSSKTAVFSNYLDNKAFGSPGGALRAPPARKAFRLGRSLTRSLVSLRWTLSFRLCRFRLCRFTLCRFSLLFSSPPPLKEKSAPRDPVFVAPTDCAFSKDARACFKRSHFRFHLEMQIAAFSLRVSRVCIFPFPFLQKCRKRRKRGKTRRKAQKWHISHFLRNLVRNRPRIHVDGRRSKVPVGAIRLSEIGIRFVIASVCSERTRSVYFFSRGAFFKRANTENEPIPGSRFWAYF